MAYFETWLTRDLKRPNVLQALKDDFFSQDNKGNRVGVIVTDNGNPVTLTGNVFGYIIRADRATVSLQGTINANKAWIDLPESAYAIVGPLQIVLRQIVGTGTAQTKTTLIACTTYVHRTTTDSFIDPGHVVPSLEELLAQIAVMEQATANANTATNRANTAADNANNKANAANTAANNANTKATAADQAATNANNAAESVKTYNNRLTAVENKFPVKIADGGTGLTASPSMLTNLASTTADNVLKANPRPGVTGTLPIANGGTGATTAPNACANLGAVKKSGDKMTGNLEFDSGLNYTGVEFKGAAGSPSVFIRNTGSRMIFDQFANGSTGGERYLLPSVESRSADAWYDIITTKPGNYQFNRLVPNIDLTSMPSAEQVSYAINFMDKNKTDFGYVASRQEPDGRVDVGFGVARTIGGTTYFNSVFTGVKPDGTKVVSLSDKQAWIAGLGLAYAPSDTYAEPASVVCGIVRNSGKQFVLRVSLQKTMENINTVSVTQLTGFMAGMNGIIGGSGATTNWLTMSGVTVRAQKRSNNTALIIVESTSVLTNAATGVLSFLGDFTLSFS